MKIIKKLILFIILVLIVVVGIYTASGYAMYKEALSAIPIDVKIEEISAIPSIIFMFFNSLTS